MRRSFRFASPVTFALVGVTVATVGCEPKEPVPVVVEESIVVETDSADAEDGAATSDATGPDPTDADAVVDASPEGKGVVGSPASGSPPAGVTTERPGDFLRPTLPDAALEEAADEEEEVAPPPVEITDRSAEAAEPTVLPGDVPIDDLFEGLDATPKPER